MQEINWKSGIIDTLVVIGPSIGYAFQYREMEIKGSSEGFAPQVSIIILVSMISRIFFWIMRKFAMPIFLQAITLVISQIFVLLQYQRFNKRKVPMFSYENVFTRYSIFNINDYNKKWYIQLDIQ